jgi:NET1-associated nuclear protein 1 (U3 small nucleolar RNA-associated protein 17)
LNRTAFWALRSSFNYQGLPVFSSAISVDGSLLALAHGSVVTLWETSSNVLLRVFDTADIEGVRKVQFLGSEGRWLALAGQTRGVGVWDLLSCQGMSCLQSDTAVTSLTRRLAAWTLPFFHQHEVISLSIPSQPYFLTSTLTSGPSPHQQTIISCFGPHSSKPIFRRAIPAKLLQVCVSGVNASHAVDASSVELTAIARDGRTLRVGEDVKPFPKQIQSVSVSAATASAQGTTVKTSNLSIWEEMFGKNAFSGTAHIDDVPEPTLSAKPLKDKRSKYSKVYDGPSTSLPPMALLFDEFLNDFMDVKPAVAPATQAPTVRFAGDGEVADTASVISSEDMLPIVDMHVNKVTMKDVQELGDWFKTVVLTSEATQPATQPTPKAKTNGTVAASVSTPRSTVKKSKGTPVSAAKSAMVVDSPASVGKKRKVVPA